MANGLEGVGAQRAVVVGVQVCPVAPDHDQGFGGLENTADSVIGLYRDEMHHQDSTDRGLAELIVLKKRQLGDDVGSVRRLVWVGESYRDFVYET
jgi:hypothetical protein